MTQEEFLDYLSKRDPRFTKPSLVQPIDPKTGFPMVNKQTGIRVTMKNLEQDPRMRVMRLFNPSMTEHDLYMSGLLNSKPQE